MIILLILSTTTLAATPQITQLNYDPSPAVPGSTITVLVQIENTDNTTQKDIAVGLIDEYPFTIVEDKEYSIGDMLGHSKALKQFKVLVSPDSENKTYNIKTSIKSANEPAILTSFSIVVSGNAPAIKITNVSDTQLIPGQSKEITFELQNVGTSTAYDVVAELREDRTVTTTGVVIEREITPLGSAVGHIDKLGPKEKATVTINMSVSRDAQLKNYVLPAVISYRTPAGTRTSETTYMGFKVAGFVMIDAAIKDKTNFVAGQTSEVNIELFNKGVGKAEFTIVEISTDFGTVDRLKEFIGALEPNDVDSFKTSINIDPNSPTKNGNIILTISYEDTDATIKTNIITLPVRVYSTADGASVNQASPILGIIGVIILIVVIFVIWKTYKKLKHHK